MEPLNKPIHNEYCHSGAIPAFAGRNPVKTINYWMPVKLQTVLSLHPAGALRATRFDPDESVTGMTAK
jgi:hypothetical protein